MRKLLVLLVFINLISGCVKNYEIVVGHENLSDQEKLNLISGYQLPMNPDADNAVIYILRPSIYLETTRINLYLEEQLSDRVHQGSVYAQSYLAIEVPAGEYNVNVAVPDPSVLESLQPKWDAISFNVSEGEILFITLTPVPGSHFELEILNEVDGKFHMKAKNLKDANCFDVEIECLS